ncbi:hypothetical protein [Flavonifractor sp. An91]|uniref:hypothetical protein n=1 Tax=Flavonifractor sp. An91 TaxID=1965665 RepID=UPI0013A6004E|nr:hypothetical protein [Flavonifractor sp. An91]
MATQIQGKLNTLRNGKCSITGVLKQFYNFAIWGGGNSVCQRFILVSIHLCNKGDSCHAGATPSIGITSQAPIVAVGRNIFHSGFSGFNLVGTPVYAAVNGTFVAAQPDTVGLSSVISIITHQNSGEASFLICSICFQYHFAISYCTLVGRELTAILGKSVEDAYLCITAHNAVVHCHVIILKVTIIICADYCKNAGACGILRQRSYINFSFEKFNVLNGQVAAVVPHKAGIVIAGRTSSRNTRPIAGHGIVCNGQIRNGKTLAIDRQYSIVGNSNRRPFLTAHVNICSQFNSRNCRVFHGSIQLIPAVYNSRFFVRR